MKLRPPTTEAELQVCLYFHFSEFWKTAARLKRLQARKAASLSRLRSALRPLHGPVALRRHD